MSTARRFIASLVVATLLVVGQSLVGPGAQASPGGSLEGRFFLHHSDDFASGKARFRPMLELADGSVLRLDLRGGRRPDPGTWVRVLGSRRADRVIVAEGGLQRAAGPDPTAAVSTKRVAVILFNFSNNTSQPYTPAYAQGITFTNTNSVAAYYSEVSWGQLTLTGDVFGWYTIPNTNETCSYSSWATAANQAAAAEGVNVSTYDNVVYAFPSTSSCSWSGLANMPGKNSWLNGTGGMSLRVMSHELGHNFGTHHASSLSCSEGGVRVSLSATSANCTASEYGDPFTVMGASSRYHHTNFSRGNFAWLTAENTQTVSTGTYTLKPIEGYDPAGVQMLRIPRTSSTYLTLEFRQPYGSYFDTFSSSDPVVNGVTVRITPGYSTRTQSQLVDTVPSTTSFSDAPLAVGKTLVDPVSGASITVTSVSPSGATVQVSFAPDTTPPSQPASLSASALDSSRVSLSWGASSDNVGVAGYRVFRDGAQVATVTSTGFTDTGLSPATMYAYQVVAFDAAGNVSSPASASATTPSLDTVSPSAPTNLIAIPSTRRRIALSWGASSDNVGVAGYRVFRNGTVVATTTGTSFTDKLSSGTRQATYYVVAFDAAGNTSAASNSVTVTL